MPLPDGPREPAGAWLPRIAATGVACCIWSCTLTGDDLSPQPAALAGESDGPGAELAPEASSGGTALEPTPSDAEAASGGASGGTSGAEQRPTDELSRSAPSARDDDPAPSAAIDAGDEGAAEVEAGSPPGSLGGEDGSDAGAPPRPGTEASPSNAAAPFGDSEPSLVGWAAMAGLGVETTTGGDAGPIAVATTTESLLELASAEEPLVIVIEGTLAAPRVVVSSNKTLRGAGSGATLLGALRIRGQSDDFVHNVIVQNLRIDAASSDVDGDGIQIHYAHHVWIDHCEVRNAPDGNLDVVHGSDFVTVSFTRFGYDPPVAPGAGLSNLIGHADDNAAEDAGRLRSTWHHNLWGEGVRGRMPRIRFGDVHLFNNLFASSQGGTAVRAATRSRVLLENNVFDGIQIPHAINELDEGPPELAATGNAYLGSQVSFETSPGSFAPPYDYVLDDVSSVADRVLGEAGPR